jgi:DNA-binding PadR family transcriptional regulator
MTERLTTTSYAILGHLALRPRTMYELATQMRRNLHFFWPRAESGIYAQGKRLERMRLARAERSYLGRRGRTTYSITARGRSALRAWLATRPAETVVESEAVLRTFLSSHGTIEDLLGAIGEVHAQAEAMRTVGREVAGEYLTGTAEFGAEMHLRALVFDFLWRQGEFMMAWADASRAEVQRWRGLDLTRTKAERARSIFLRASGRPG